MKLRATETPTATPTPVSPTATAAATAPTAASIWAVLLASRSTLPTKLSSLPMLLFSM
jgi:hypothetical protein